MYKNSVNLEGRKMKNPKPKKGIALIICMIFLCIFSAVSLTMINMAGTNAKTANNYKSANLALTGSQSGLEIMRYYLNGMRISGALAPAARLAVIAYELDSETSFNMRQR